MPVRRFAALASAASLGATGAWAPVAAAQTPDACTTAHENVQVARAAGQLLRARREAGLCAAPECAQTTAQECGRWAEELEGSIPTVIVEAENEDGSVVRDVTFTIDGEPRRHPTDGTPVRVDPGQHVVYVTGKAWQPATVRFVATEGEHGKRVLATMERAQAATPAARGTLAPTGADDAPMLAYVTAAAGGFALGGAAFFAWQGLGIRRDLDEIGCRPSCPTDRVDEMRTDLLLADIFFGASLVAFAGALYLFIAPNEPERDRTPAKESATTSWNATLLPSVGGLGAAINGRF